jgi:hypothetical protein
MKRLLILLAIATALFAVDTAALADSGWFIVLFSNPSGPAYGGPYASWSDCNRVKNAAMGTDAYLYTCSVRYY